QLQYAISGGHDVQLHIHPHWLTSEYDGKNFHPSNDFSLSDFRNDTKFGGIPGIVKRAVDSLRETVAQYNTIQYNTIQYNTRKL
ncbi:MAG: hypothetical protein LBE91_05810, partial [Tannerella sp.]|nr:hypothetical protein [Tannerella sp.]